MDTRLAVLARAARTPPAGIPFLEAVGAVRASNAWVVGPEMSSSGKPLLANDMHLSLDAPTIWYLVGLHAPGMDVVGMSLPGSPGVVAGHTPAVAWGLTNAALDDVDFFVERVDPSDTTRYQTPTGSSPFRLRQEVIAVKGRPPDTLVVRETRHGPIVTPVESRAGEDLLALRWIAHDVAGTPEAVVRLNRAESAQDVIAALRLFDDPHQNVVFADTSGRWGYWMAGRVPIRRSGHPPLLPVPGWTGEHDWIGDLPFELHPHVLEPAEGFVVTANNRQGWDSISELVTDGTWAGPYRAIRIRERIGADSLHDAESMHAIQLDVGSSFVRRYRDVAAWSFRSAGFDALAGRLERWDGRSTLDSRAATLFHTWFAQLRQELRRETYGSVGGYFPRAAAARALDRGEVSEEILHASAREAAGSRRMPWGEAHRLHLDHPLAGVPVLGRLLGFGRADIPREGSTYSPNVASAGGSTPPFSVRSGPSQRHVVDLGDPDGSGGFVIAGGQSGWPAGRHSFDQLGLWRAGELIPIPLSRPAVEARAGSRLTLVPR